MSPSDPTNVMKQVEYGCHPCSSMSQGYNPYVLSTEHFLGRINFKDAKINQMLVPSLSTSDS